jgi:hypothetical protein
MNLPQVEVKRSITRIPRFLGQKLRDSGEARFLGRPSRGNPVYGPRSRGLGRGEGC